MENDSIRSSGTSTLIDLWIKGKLRGICVTEEAIGAFVGFAQAADMTERDRCEFVREHLALVLSAAKARLQANPTAEPISIDAGQLPRPDGRVGDRRKKDRREGERRKSDRQKPDPAQADRRRGDRRKGERRRSPKSQ